MYTFSLPIMPINHCILKPRTEFLSIDARFRFIREATFFKFFIYIFFYFFLLAVPLRRRRMGGKGVPLRKK